MRLFNHPQRFLLITCLVISALLTLAFAACAHNQPASVAPESAAAWTFQWPDDVPVSTALPQAVLTNGHAEDPHGNLRAPASIQWLAAQPTFGVALIQLDATNTWISLVYFRAATTWTIAGEVTLARPTAQTGSRADQILALPQDLYIGQVRVQAYDPSFTLRLWLSPTRAFAFGYVHESSHAISPNARAVTVEGYRGWFSPSADFTGIVLPIGHETLIFSGSAATTLIKQLTGESVIHLAKLTNFDAEK